MGVVSPLLATRNMKATIDFYRDVLGFTLGMVFPDIDNPEYADLSKDGMSFMFVPAKNLGISRAARMGTGVNLYLQLDGDIDEYCGRLKQKDVKITSDIKDEPYGVRDFTIEDNNGYQLTFNAPSKTAKTCLSCGMPMTKPEDFGASNPGNLYCVHCSNPDGSLKSYEDVFEGMVNFMMQSQKIDRAAAEVATKEYMSRMAAWGGPI